MIVKEKDYRLLVACSGRILELFLQKEQAFRTRTVSRLFSVNPQTKVRLFISHTVRFQPVEASGSD